MAHYAFLNEDNIVVDVIVGKDEFELDNEGNSVDWELYYSEFRGLKCKRTSYNTVGGKHLQGKQPFRKNYAGIGYQYLEEWDAFCPPRPFDSWSLDYETFHWVPPVPRPEHIEGFVWKWNEISKEWDKIQA